MRRFQVAWLLLAAIACGDAVGPTLNLIGLEIVALEDRVIVGRSIDLAAVGRDADGALVDEIDVHWTSGDPSVARVDDGGVVHGVSAGRTAITAERDDLRGVLDLTVIEGVAEIRIVGSTTVTLGDTIQLAARLLDADQRPVEERPVDWRSTDLSVLLVSKDGAVRGAGLGEAAVVARVEGVADTFSVRVLPAGPGP